MPIKQENKKYKQGEQKVNPDKVKGKKKRPSDILAAVVDFFINIFS